MSGWNGSGVFDRQFSWVSDAAAGIDISASRTDTDTDLIASNGFGNCLTRDGQGSATANLPMNTFKFTGLGAGSANTDSVTLGQAQAATANWVVFGGTADAITATYAPVVASLVDGQLFFGRATTANATTTPTFSPNGIGPYTITKNGGAALAANDIDGQYAEVILRYNLANTRFELMNPSGVSTATLASSISTGVVWLTLASSPPTGWLMFDDGTFGSAASGSSNSNSTLNQALFDILYASPFTDSTCPLLTSTGAGTTRAAQGTAAAAWAANCRMTLPKTLGRALAVAGSGSGLTTRALGSTIGAESHSLAAGEIPSLTSSAANNISVTPSVAPTGSVAVEANGVFNGTFQSATPGTSGSYIAATNSGGWGSTNTFTGSNAISVTYTNGSQTAVSLMQPTNFLNAMVKV